MAVDVGGSPPPYINRQTLCIAGSTPGLATHAGEDDFAVRLRRNYRSDESNVAEQLILFKDELSKLDGEVFWTRLMEGMTEICHGQFAFVSKRILVDDHTTAVEMPKIGEEGSCLMAVALYYNDGKAIRNIHHNYKYYAWSCPCAYMKHDKVFLIEGDLTTFIQNNPNQIPFEPESYLGVPLFAKGKCYAHFGMMWTKEGMQRRQRLSWTFIELFMHSLEDMITAKLLAGQGFAKTGEKLQQETTRIIPQAAITATQSLKVYARSLSHELRTPMQGVVGMLDLMYATVQEQIEGQNSHKIRQIFQSLKNNIEVVQDSSKRAVEAADNVVHAYDLNMQIPETPSHEYDSPQTATGSYFDIKPNMTDGSQIFNPNKRKRSMETAMAIGNATKRYMASPRSDAGTPLSPLRKTIEVDEGSDISPRRKSPPLFQESGVPGNISLPKPPVFPSPTSIELETTTSTPGLRQSNIREALPIVINDSLRVGGRPDFAVTEPTTLGERIEVKSRSSNGDSSSKSVNWSVDPDVPYMIPIDERDFAKLVGAVFLNAVKFTDFGDIDIRVRLSHSKKFVMVNIVDTGMGIPEAFQPELFKAFSKEDDSLTRTREGLGLGLMVAKGLARRIGGDLNLVRSAIEGPSQGSEFEIRIPLEAGEVSSRATTPSRSFEPGSIPRSIPPVPTPNGAASPTPITKLERTSPGRIDTNITTPQNIANGKIVNLEPFKIKTPPPIQRRVSSTPKSNVKPDRQLGSKYPLTFLVAEDNKINRKLLVQMLHTLGYKDVHEAYDGKEAVRVVERLITEKRNRKRRGSNTTSRVSQTAVDVILMDLWMPELDGYQATEQILKMYGAETSSGAGDAGSDTHIDLSDPSGINGYAVGIPPTILAVSADVTDTAIARATKIGMAGYMSKPFKVLDLQKLILEFCVSKVIPPGAVAA